MYIKGDVMSDTDTKIEPTPLRVVSGWLKEELRRNEELQKQLNRAFWHHANFWLPVGILIGIAIGGLFT